MSLTLNTVPNILAAGFVVLLALGLVLVFIGRFLRAGGRVRGKGLEVGQGGCEAYVAEHSAALARIEAGQASLQKKLGEMDEQRTAARLASIEADQSRHRETGKIMIALDGMMDAMQSANIGNGNLTRARNALAEFSQERDEYLIDSLAREAAKVG